MKNGQILKNHIEIAQIKVEDDNITAIIFDMKTLRFSRIINDLDMLLRDFNPISATLVLL
jgi:cell fate regulator YaaT (PSP1 superfamily)